MHSDLEKLLKLEKMDGEIARLQSEIAALPKRVAEIETKLAGNLASVEKAKTAAKTNEQNRRKYEAEIRTLQEKISKYRDQMLSVKTNEEYRALGNQIKFAEDGIRGFEDKILECMVSAEDLDKNIKAAEKDLTGERAEVEKEKNRARERTAEAEKAVRELMPQRSALRATISDEWVRHYDRVLKQRGSALAEMLDGACSGCRELLRLQVYNDVIGGETVCSCDSCSRILYYVPPEKPATVTTAETKTESAPADPQEGVAEGSRHKS